MAGKRSRSLLWLFSICVFFLSSLAGGCTCIYILPPGQFPAAELGPDGGNGRDSVLLDQQDAAPEEPVIEEPVVEEPVSEEPVGDPEPDCQDGERRQCDTKQLGVCKDGEEVCVDGRWGRCERLTNPSIEVCDGLDNDCDGDVDEKLVRECPYAGPEGTKGVSHCKAGKQTCEQGAWGQCVGESLPIPESCNGRDDDCDGAIDEWLPIQQIGSVRTYSTRGDPSHLYMVSTQTGYAFGWSETQTQRVLLTRVSPSGARVGQDWGVTQGSEIGNIHGLAYTGKYYAVSWDTDEGGRGGDAYVALLDQNGKRVKGPQLLAKGGRMVNTQVSAGPTGYLGVVWSDFNKLQLFAQILDTNLKPVAAPLAFDISTSVSPYPGSTFSGDRMGTIWVDKANKLQFAAIDLKGKQVGNTKTIPYPGNTPRDPNLTGDGNGFLVVWSDASDGKLWGQRLDRTGTPQGKPNEFASSGARTPILKATDFGGVVAWIQVKTHNSLPTRGISIARIDKNGKLLSQPSWFAVPNIEDYVSLAWTDLGKGMGRGAIGWIENQRTIKVAPLGCR